MGFQKLFEDHIEENFFESKLEQFWKKSSKTEQKNLVCSLVHKDIYFKNQKSL